MNKQICSERHILFIYYAFLYIFYINSGEVNIKHFIKLSIILSFFIN